MSLFDDEPTHSPTLSELAEAEQNVHALPFTGAFEQAMIDCLVMRESHLHFSKDDSIQIDQAIIPRGLTAILYSELNHLAAVEMSLSILASHTEHEDDTSELTVRFIANNTPYEMHTDHTEASLHYTTSDGAPASRALLPQDVIALVASIALATQKSDPQDSLPPIRDLGPNRADFAMTEQFFATIAQHVGQLATTTTSLFVESDQAAIIAKLVETTTPKTDKIQNVLNIDKVGTHKTEFIEAQLEQFITYRPNRIEQRFGTIQQSQIPPSEYPFLRLYGLSDSSQFPEHTITPSDDSSTWQQLCYDFMQTIAPRMQANKWIDDSHFNDD